jgi:hypothetical protein
MSAGDFSKASDNAERGALDIIVEEALKKYLAEER